MNNKPPGNSGFTWIEALVALAIIGILVALVLPALTTTSCGRSITQPLSNMKQLQLATYQMALDGETMKDTNLGWPGDIGGTFTNWTAQLLKGGYLTTNDLCKLLSAQGKIVPLGKIPPMFDTAILVYAVRDNSSNNTVFLTTANFTNTPTGGLPPERSAKPLGNKGFIVFRKGGGAVLFPKQAGDTNLIGTFVPLCR